MFKSNGELVMVDKMYLIGNNFKVEKILINDEQKKKKIKIRYSNLK